MTDHTQNDDHVSVIATRYVFCARLARLRMAELAILSEIASSISQTGLNTEIHFECGVENVTAWDFIPLGGEPWSITIISSDCTNLDAVMILRGVSNQTVSSVGVTYTSSISLVDSVEASEMCLVDKVLRDHTAKPENDRPLGLNSKESLGIPPARAMRALSLVTGTMLGKAYASDTIERVALTWKGPDTASLELNDLSTFNAMTPSLLQGLAVLM